MRQLVLKTLYFFSLGTILFFLCTNIYNPQKFDSALEINGFLILAIICAIVLPFVIFYATNKNKWFMISASMAILTLVCVFYFRADIFQKTIFINQLTSNYKSQQKFIGFINDNEKDVNQLVKEIEEQLKWQNYRGSSEIFWNDRKYGTSVYKFVILKYSIKNEKVQNLVIQASGSKSLSAEKYSAAFYPHGLSEYDKNIISKNEIYESETKFYLDICKKRIYLHKNKWVYVVGDDCHG